MSLYIEGLNLEILIGIYSEKDHILVFFYKTKAGFEIIETAKQNSSWTILDDAKKTILQWLVLAHMHNQYS